MMKTESSTPIEQEAKKGHSLLRIGNDTYVEVSMFNNKQYASIRRWFQADDGIWYRTKNGLNMLVDDMLAVLRNSESIIEFIEAERNEIKEEREW